ncbi:SMP-30/gluconolactonase/LRE family protein [Cyanobium sp. HWJ4-Hawea]|nr:SMP-30/gluconolactonase/LRE family protein [Cyanobium sp. HWJ4-Hawea]
MPKGSSSTAQKAIAGIATLGITLITGCQKSTWNPPTGSACLPGNPQAKQCRDVSIINNPVYPESQSPQLTVISLDPEFEEIVGRTPNLVPLATGFGFLEGPVFLKEKNGNGGILFVTDQIHNSIYSLKWKGLINGQITKDSWEEPRLFRNPSGVADGQTPDLQGNLLTAETTGRRISITRSISANLKNPNPQAPTLVGSYQGKRLNSPNDLVVKTDGTVWFTDPSYGSLQFPPQPAELPNNVYRYDPKNKQLKVVAPGLVMPNGIAFGPGERTLYIIDSGAIQGPRTYYPYLPHSIYLYDVLADGKTLANKRLFANVAPGFPDGMRLDEKGNVYVGTLEGIHVINPQGKLIGKFLMAKQTANLSFGGADNNVLFIGSSNTLWAVKLNVKGQTPIQTRPEQ